jgi:glycosyltransferase involved in cell wall biosynthesis
MKRSILFIDEDQERNGATVSLEYLVKGFKEAGYNTVVLTWKQEDWTKAALKSSATLIDGRWGPLTTTTMCFHFTYTVSPLSWAGMKNIIKDLVKFVAGFIIVLRTIRKVRPDIVYLNEYSVVQASLAARASHVPSVVHIRSQILTGLFGVRHWLMRRLVLMCNDAVFSITRCEAEQLRPHPAEQSKISVVGEFVPPRGTPGVRQADVRSSLGLPLDRCVVTMLGGILAIKGTREFLQAGEKILARRPTAFLCLAGGSRIGGDPVKRAYDETCRDLIARLEQRGNLRYLGEISNPLDLVAASDVVVSPSLQTHFARPVVEAWGAGKPVVAFRSPHMEALIAHGVDGLLVDSGDVDGLAEAIGRLLDDVSLRMKLGQEGYKKTERDFNAERNLAGIIARCDALCAAS